ncbi:hypothetical protein BCU99_06270 [Vibrio cyclitrophicus]|uniref:hypothetical protein n=1 Tax=Vibrio cyclitrophicus TaxID=47951 RepID=UPI00067EC379|nr:hypothetical protein [Vibrio cyclitrophicus]KNH13676.1 hypothetical protein ACS79_06735 [Vibrio lentus]PMG14464.1 hypothetical protein BCU99_10630 [Vibrio cyclitrophicus]
MKIIKKDFVNENTESYCAKGHKLSSGTAYFMQAKDGIIYFGGKQCAELHGTNNIKDVPDLTKSLVSLTSNTTSGGGGGGKASEGNDKAIAVAYLLLRQELMNDFRLNNRVISHDNLRGHYESYRDTGELSESAVKHIVRTELYVAKNIDEKLSLKNLSTCHAYKFILDRTSAHLRAKDKTDGVEFVASLKRYLLANCTLTTGQVSGLKRWIQYLPNDLKSAKLKDF